MWHKHTAWMASALTHSDLEGLRGGRIVDLGNGIDDGEGEVCDVLRMVVSLYRCSTDDHIGISYGLNLCNE